MKRFWVRFYCVGPKKGRKPKWLQWWVSGYGMDDTLVCCAVIDRCTEDEAGIAVQKYFHDAEIDFCDLKSPDWLPGDRFPGARAMGAK